MVVLGESNKCACLCVCLGFFPATTLINQILTSMHAHPTHTQQPAGVTAHHVAVGDGQRDKTVFLIKFRQDVLRREAALSS